MVAWSVCHLTTQPCMMGEQLITDYDHHKGFSLVWACVLGNLWQPSQAISSYVYSIIYHGLWQPHRPLAWWWLVLYNQAKPSVLSALNYLSRTVTTTPASNLVAASAPTFWPSLHVLVLLNTFCPDLELVYLVIWQLVNPAEGQARRHSQWFTPWLGPR